MFTKTFQEKKSGLLKIFLITGIVFLSACKSDIINKEPPLAQLGVEKILILTFQDMSAVYGENVNVRCPVCGNVFMTGKVAEGADHDLTEHLFFLLKDRKDIILIPASQAQGVLSGLLSENKFRLSEKDFFVEIGRALEADAVIAGNIYRFRERIGTQYSVDSPASVAFDIHLIRVADGHLLWRGHFNETQRSLSENLFRIGTFLRRKARWITAQEMAMSGLEDVLKTFPNSDKSEPK